MGNESSSQRLYAFVDESGMESAGTNFVVAIVIVGNPQYAVTLCEEIERISGKGKSKWGKSNHARRIDYLRRAFSHPDLRGHLCYVLFRKTKNFEDSTIEAIARAVEHFAKTPKYKVSIFVDALSKTKRRVYGARLRKLGIQTYKVQGIDRDESNALIRLADAIAGFVRDAKTGENAEIAELFKDAEKSGALIEK